MIGDKEYEFEDDKLLVKDARLIKKLTGMGLKSFSEGIKDGDPDALCAMVFLAKRKAGEAVQWKDLDELDLATIQSLDDENEEEEEGDKAASADPTVTGESTPESEPGTILKLAEAAT